MKLIFCPECQDIVKLRIENYRYCWCGKSSGQYCADGLNAIVYGKAIPIGFSNTTFENAIRLRKYNTAISFKAFVIERKCKTILKKDTYDHEFHKNYCSRKRGKQH